MTNEASGCESNAIELLKQKLRHNFASLQAICSAASDTCCIRCSAGCWLAVSPPDVVVLAVSELVSITARFWDRLHCKCGGAYDSLAFTQTLEYAMFVKVLASLQLDTDIDSQIKIRMFIVAWTVNQSADGPVGMQGCCLHASIQS